MTPPETLQALCRLEPVRFAEYKPGVFWVNVPDNSLELRDLEGFYGQALLSAALLELVDSRGWLWTHNLDGGITLWDKPSLMPVGSGPDGQPFALTLAWAVVSALEAEGG